MKNRIILVGGGGHCRSCIDVIEKTGEFQIEGIVEKPGVKKEGILGYPILGDDDDLEELRKSISYCLVTVGHIKSSMTRVTLYKKLKTLNYIFPVIISPLAYISKYAVVGENTIVMHRATVNAGARIGNNCILNTCSLVEHDAIVGDHTHVSTCAVVNGNASVGSGCFIGSNSTVVQGAEMPNHYFFRANQLIVSKKDGYPIIPE